MSVGTICKATFKLDPSFLGEYEGRQPEWGPLGYVTYKRTYARKLDINDLSSPTEEWWQTCARVVSGAFSIQKNHCNRLTLPWSEDKAQRTAQKMFEAMWDFKFLPPGRGLWSMGTPNLEKIGGMSLNNCGFVSTEDMKSDPTRPFTFLMDCSMLGVGVGFDTLGAGTVRIKDPANGRHPDEDDCPAFIIPDSREGWIRTVELTLRAYLLGEVLYRFDYSQVRPAGLPIKGFGGISSGPGPLRSLVRNIVDVFTGRAGELLTSEDIVDVQNLIGKCVVSGNVRRSAELALGLPDDKVFAALKQDREKLLSHRWASNNSICATEGMDYQHHAALSAINGEPGYVWLENMQKYGRMGDPPDNRDYRVRGANPCVEQTLESYELCCLVETFPSRHASLAEYCDTLKLAYLYAKTVTLVPTHWPETNAVLLRNRRIGCSQSGITNAFDVHGRREILRWCDVGYKYIGGLDVQYSQWLCVPASIKRTSVKPSGTISLLPPNINPGIHRGPSEYYVRRMRISASSEIVPALEAAGYDVEPSVTSPDDTVVASFPVHDTTFTVGESDVSMWEQMEIAAQVQHYWADNSVSVTIKFSPDEACQIADALSMYETRLKAVSFLPHADHGYDQAPIEPVDRHQYEEMSSRIRPEILYGALNEGSDGGKSLFCDSDRCEVRVGS